MMRKGTPGKASMPGTVLMALLPALLLPLSPALSAPVENRIALFAALDKITGEITTLEVPIDREATFGTFHIRPRTCHTRPATEEPRTMAFIEIDEYTYDNRHRRIFTGWMNAESPGLHAVEHPLFDVWLTGCRQPLSPSAEGGEPSAPPPAAAAPGEKADILSQPPASQP